MRLFALDLKILELFTSAGFLTHHVTRLRLSKSGPPPAHCGRLGQIGTKSEKCETGVGDIEAFHPPNVRRSTRHSRKEVIQPQVPLRLPCYDFTPVMNPTVVSAPLAVRLPTSGETHSHGVTGGVYKTRERIHRGMLIHDY